MANHGDPLSLRQFESQFRYFAKDKEALAKLSQEVEKAQHKGQKLLAEITMAMRRIEETVTQATKMVDLRLIKWLLNSNNKTIKDLQRVLKTTYQQLETQTNRSPPQGAARAILSGETTYTLEKLSRMYIGLPNIFRNNLWVMKKLVRNQELSYYEVKQFQRIIPSSARMVLSGTIVHGRQPCWEKLDELLHMALRKKKQYRPWNVRKRC